jgi:hypothetical protein
MRSAIEGLPSVARIARTLAPDDRAPLAGPLVVQCVWLGDIDQRSTAVAAVCVSAADLGEVVVERQSRVGVSH